MKYFSNKPVNTGRQPEIDMSKAFMILLMIMIHVFQGLAPETKGFLQTIMGYGAGFFGAGSFMIFMGIGMRFSRHQDSKNLVIRGIALLTVSQLKNLLIDCIPGLIAYRVSGSDLFFEMMLGAIQSDILTFAGLAFLLMALLKKIRMRDEWILLLGVVMNFLMIPVAAAEIFPENYWVNRILGMFIVTADALFPLCQHFVFAAFGYLIGGFYTRITDKEALAKRVLMICVPIVTVYFALRFSVPFPFLPEYIPEDEPALGTDALAVCMDTLILIAVMYKISARIGGKAPAFVNHLSRHINSYYCISDVLSGCARALLLVLTGEFLQSSLIPFLFGLLVTAACYFLIEINEKYIHFTVSGLRGTKRIVVYAAVWAASIGITLYVLKLIPNVSEMI